MAKPVTITRLGTRELWDAFRANPIKVYNEVSAHMREADIEERPTFSRALELISPTDPKDTSGLDAFGRMMMEAGIRTRSNPQGGWWASTALEFLRDDATRALMYEFGQRAWRKVSMRSLGMGMPQGTRAPSTFLSDDVIPGTYERPWQDIRPPRWDEMMAPAIPLTELVAVTTPITGGEYRSLEVVWDAEEARAARVAEGTDIPLATIRTSPAINDVHKYGRGVQITYEAARRLRLDRLAWYFQMFAIQAEMDKVVAGLDVMINGDGNAGTAAEVIALTTLDPDATPGTLTLKAWLAFKMEFVSPYMLTHALMRPDVALNLALLNTGSANLPLSGVNLGGLGTMLMPINTFADGTRYGWTADAPADVIVGYDGRMALERAVETGSQITESERFIRNQTEVVVMSEVEGFGVLDASAVKILDLSA